MDFKEYSLPPNPMAGANPISKLLFLWIFPLFKKGYQKELQDEDLYEVLKEDETGRIGDKLEKYWNLELERAKRTGNKPSFLRVLIKISWKTFALASVIYTAIKLTIPAAQAISLKLLIQTFNDGDTESWKGYFYAAVISVTVFINTITIQPNYFQIMHLGMKLRVGVSTLIYRKTLRLSKSAQHETNSGQIVNLLSNDCARFDLAMNFIPCLMSGPFQVILLMYLLYNEIGAASFAGVGFIFIVIPWQYYLGKYTPIFRMKIAKRTDERGRFMNEIIVGMRVIKQYAWEKPFSILIDKLRRLEVIELRKRGLLRGLHLGVLIFAPKLVQYFTFLALVLIGAEPMSADKVFFTLICLYHVMQTLVHVSPLAVSGIGEILVTIRRVQDFLLLQEQRTNNSISLYNGTTITKIDELEEVKKLYDDNNDNLSLDVIINNSVNTITKRVSMKNVCASWTDDRVTLDNINFSVEEDKLIMIVGPVGSSKTSLLHAILDELPISSGNLNISGRVSYAAQEPWIFSGNLRQNILFGLPHEEGRYNATLAACALEEDLKQLPYGDMTVVGERGVALSGGQKARVNLARALYRKADIYLLDDPLSAVDSRVSRHLFEKCMKEHLRGSIRLLVTHQLQYLPQADHIVVLSQGKILAQGKYKELVTSGIDFAGLLRYGHESGDDDGASDDDSADRNDALESKQLDRGKPEENLEKKMAGSVTIGTYKEYFMAGHSAFDFITLMSTFLVCQVLTNGNDYWLSYWTNAEAKRVDDLKNNMTSCTDYDNEVCEDTYLGENVYLYVYTGFVVGVTVLNLTRCLWFYVYSAEISVSIHDKMFRSMVRAPIKFYDDNPSGRIMNRFTKDVGTMDELLPPAFIDTIIILLQGIGTLGVVVISNYYMSIPTVILFVVLYVSRRVFVRTARDIKRIESITKSPIFTHVTATIQGLTTIRASKSQGMLIQQFEGHQDIHSTAWFSFLSVNRCFAVWLELISDVFLAIVAFSFLLMSTSQEGGNVGLAIASLLTVMDIFQWGMRMSAETENFMTSVERALEYSKLTPEAELESKPSSKPSKDWPNDGQIELRNVSLRYSEETPVVLKNLSFEIRPSEKIGIVGRTGAGKSSIITALFRLTEPEGEILIDNVDVKQIGLHDLRKNISIIPQDPVLFSGTVRYNLDPFNQFQDNDLWKVIEEVELKDAVSSLEFKVTDGGSNFSVGERQLVCLARAILRKNKILVMDEATANVDPRTDHLIQQTIRSKFSHCTIITIAHRLHSIIDCDRVLVLDQGQLVEYDHPRVLLQDEAGIFSAMIAQTGQSTSTMLKKLASDSLTGSEM